MTKNKCSYIITLQRQTNILTLMKGVIIMKIINKRRFIKSNLILVFILGIFIFFTTNTYSKVEVEYKEEYIYSGDTLWSIAENELKNNKYFEDKDIRYVISELKKINNLSNSSLKEGDKIKIPNY